MAHTYVGVDLGSHTIKVVEVAGGRGGVQLLNVGVVPTPPGTIINGQVNDPEAVAQALKQVLATNGIKTRAAVSVLSGQSVIVRIISVPRMAPGELKNVMRHEIERHIPFSIDEVVWDYRVIQRPDEDPKSPNMEVIFAAAQEDAVRSHVELLQAAGLEPHAIEVEPLAVSRLLLDLAGPEVGKGETVAILNIGAATTEIAIVRDRLLHFPRTIPIGGENLTKAIAEAMGIDVGMAERMKREHAQLRREFFAAPPPAEEAAPAAPAGRGLFVPTGGTLDEAEEPFAPPTPEAAAPAEEELPRFELEEALITTPAEPEVEALDFEFSLEDEDVVVRAEPEEEAREPVFELDESVLADLGISVSEEAPSPPSAEEGAKAAEAEEAAPPAPVEEAVLAPMGEEARRAWEVYDAMLPVLGELVTEVRRSLEYYRSRHEGVEVNRIIVVGGTARMPGLADFLTEELGIPTERGDPIASLVVANPNLSQELLYELSPVLAVALGLAVRDLIG